MCSGLLKLTKANVISARVTGISLHSSGEPGHGGGSGCTGVGGWWWQCGGAGAGEHPGPGKAFGRGPGNVCLLSFPNPVGPCSTNLSPEVSLLRSSCGTILIAGLLPHPAQQKNIWGLGGGLCSPSLLCPH